MKYTDEVLKIELMHYLDYAEQDAVQLIEFYKRNDKLEALTAVIEEKKEACSRL